MRNTRNSLVVVLAVIALGHLSSGLVRASGLSAYYEGMPLIEIVPRPADGGIREEVPKAYKIRFAKWKSDLLSAEFGRRQWELWANASHVIVTIRVVEKRGKGAGTDKFAWSADGEFAGATITLGPELDSGLPPPVYYPVLNALAEDSSFSMIDPALIAAAKLSHELGHVEQASKADMKLMLLQSKLVPEYVEIFLKNGLDSQDRRLRDIELQIGGTPTKIWEQREYDSEVDAMRFVAERLDGAPGLCRFAKRLKRNLAEYAGSYEQRFDALTKLLDKCST